MVIHGKVSEKVRLRSKSAAFFPKSPEKILFPKLPEKILAWETWARGTTAAKAMLILALLPCSFFEPDDR